MKRWCIVYTGTGMEGMAVGHLANQGLKVYLPQRSKERRHARRIDTIKSPLFPQYLFVKLDLLTNRWHTISGIYGVNYLVTVGERPSTGPLRVVETIRAAENGHGLVNVIEITQDAFSDQTGVFQCDDDKQRVTLLLSLLGREMEFHLPANLVRTYG